MCIGSQYEIYENLVNIYYVSFQVYPKCTQKKNEFIPVYYIFAMNYWE